MRRAGLIALAVIAIAPPLIVVARSLHAGAYAKVLSDYGGALLFSLKLATSVVVASLLIAVPAAYGFVRHPFRQSRFLEQFAMLPLTLPGVTVAVALIVTFGAFRGGPLVLACGQMLYTIPYVVGVMTASMRTRSLDEIGDAARTLGATSRQRFRRITLPLLKPALFFVLVIETISAFQTFDTVYVMTGGGPARATYTLIYGIYDHGFRSFDFGYAATWGMVLFALVLIVSLIQRRFLDRGNT